METRPTTPRSKPAELALRDAFFTYDDILSLSWAWNCRSTFSMIPRMTTDDFDESDDDEEDGDEDDDDDFIEVDD